MCKGSLHVWINLGGYMNLQCSEPYVRQMVQSNHWHGETELRQYGFNPLKRGLGD